jgi:tetratricopeptide (TPR) repeat protein
VDLGKADPKVATLLELHMNAVRQNPGSGEAWGWLGALLWVYDYRPAAHECLNRAERLDPRNPRWPYFHARSLAIATPNDALPFMQKAARLCGNSPEAPRFRLAALLAEQGRWDEARQELQALTSGRPEFTPALLLGARAALAKGELDSAIEIARRCTNDPRTARGAWVLLATLHRQKGDLAAAKEALERSTAVPADEGFGDPFEAEVTLLRGDPRVLCEQAHPLLAGGHITQAAALIDGLKKEHADYAETWLLAGRLQLIRKDLGAAEQSLRRHMQMSPRSAQGLFQLGLVLLAQERFGEAAALFDQATQLKRDFGPAYYNRGFALARAGQPREAIAAFRESLRHNPERIDTYVLLADLHLRAGERDAALAVINQGQALNPADQRLRTLRARAESTSP